MCARCLKEGGEADFSDLPKRKKKRKPVAMMAYIPTEEEERLALELDKDIDHNQAKETPIENKVEMSNNIKVRGEGTIINMADLSNTNKAADTFTIIGETAIVENRLATEEDLNKVYTGRSEIEGLLDSSWESGKGSSGEGPMLVIFCSTEYGSVETNHQYIQSEFLSEYEKSSSILVVNAEITELSKSESRVRQLVDSTIARTKAVSSSSADSGAILCCVGFPLNLVGTLWRSREDNWSELIVVDPPSHSQAGSSSQSPLGDLEQTTADSSMNINSNFNNNYSSSPSSTGETELGHALSELVQFSWGYWFRARSVGRQCLAGLSVLARKLPMLRVALKIFGNVSGLIVDQATRGSRGAAPHGDEEGALIAVLPTAFSSTTDDAIFRFKYSPHYLSNSTQSVDQVQLQHIQQLRLILKQ